ncbi:3-phosphoshikimate 1-carboxyvinyltransferase [Pusillimonas sp. CC-YST705]|uniref:3-phosphoshikimate 1-carboxyvinyltransferase n=1 Tax=Mesopusillimonas faecipullorum TaxID=2755040 RepID=A0ABS8CD91_9BURK|nr:3-phosphoshikimate 1-carboxyvinyltransferase [Mesopusillimonas faecipullorum]MCB5363993.1 3-phosphoshikimate 1-carboxyvinyltransferase [Mesopusillimonas faecipullorum]
MKPTSTSANTLVLSRAQLAQGEISLPGSKSISNRVLLLAALAKGRTRLSGLLDSDDTRVMLAALRQLDVKLEDHGDGRLDVEGGLAPSSQRESIFLGNAGTAFRPLTAALAMLGGHYHLHGVARMHERPIGDLVDALVGIGADIRYAGNEGYPPLDIASGSIRGGQALKVKGSVSSQFLTALLLASPLCTASTGHPLIIEVEGELISKPYVLITLNLMARFGVDVQREGWHRFIVPAASAYVAPGELAIEGDASSASYFMALGAIGGGPVKVRGVGSRSIQGDIAFADVLQRMGAVVQWETESVQVSGVQVAKGERLKAFDEDFNLIPDAAMTAAALAMFADGPCLLRNIASWRVKETDRIHAMHTELARLGAQVESGPDWLRVHPIADHAWRDAAIETYDDHRMAMCFSLASFGPARVTILDPACVAKTFPDYFQVFHSLIQEQSA